MSTGISKHFTRTIKNNNDNVEYITCEDCNHVNVISNKKNQRRTKIDVHARVERPIWHALLSLAYTHANGSVNDILALLIYEYDKIQQARNVQTISRMEVKEFE